MATTKRARTAGILSFCLLLLSSLGASGALAGAAPLETAASQAAAIVIGTNSCVGTYACLDADGPIGDNSCNGDLACSGTSGAIGDNSCVGENACLGVFGGDIGDNSCNGGNACVSKFGSVGNHSCNGLSACQIADANVGNFSCNGSNVCSEAASNVGDCQFNTVMPAECAQPDARIRRIGKHNMVGNDIYNTDGTNQTLTDTLGDRAVRFVITIQNDGLVADSFTIDSTNGLFAVELPPVNFYHGWHPAEDITAAVMAGTYTTPTLAPGGVYRIRAVARPSQIVFNHLTAGPGIPHYSWLVTATSVGNTTKADAVRFTVEVPFT